MANPGLFIPSITLPWDYFEAKLDVIPIHLYIFYYIFKR